MDRGRGRDPRSRSRSTRACSPPAARTRTATSARPRSGRRDIYRHPIRWPRSRRSSVRRRRRSAISWPRRGIDCADLSRGPPDADGDRDQGRWAVRRVPRRSAVRRPRGVAHVPAGRADRRRARRSLAAILVAFTPIFMFQSLEPMSDVPATAWWLLAWVLVLSPGGAAAFGAGLCGIRGAADAAESRAARGSARPRSRPRRAAPAARRCCWPPGSFPGASRWRR